MPEPQIIRHHLGSPDAITVQTEHGVFVIADPTMSDDQLEHVTTAAELLGPLVPRQRTAEDTARGVG